MSANSAANPSRIACVASAASDCTQGGALAARSVTARYQSALTSGTSSISLASSMNTAPTLGIAVVSARCSFGTGRLDFRQGHWAVRRLVSAAELGHRVCSRSKWGDSVHYRTTLLLATTLLLPLGGTGAAADEPAPTPPMGWNSWNKFGCDINEQLITETADAIAASGLKDAGYTHVNIDDCWMAPERGADGRLQPDPVRFPSGIKAIADHVHGLGLKLGIYSSAGTKTCQGLPASLDHEEVDAATFAEWGVDYLKYDNCHNEGRPAVERYRAMGDALRATGRPIVYSICEWGENAPWEWGREVGGHLWRTTGDISDSWSSMTDLLDRQVGIEQHSGPNGWNDPDMLEVGNGGMTDAEYRAHFSLWALLNAPLLAGNDVREMDQPTKDILLNRELIAVNQDWGGKQGHRVRDDGETEVWAKPMSDGSVAVVLFNRSGADQDIRAGAGEVGLPEAPSYRVRDLWTGGESGSDGEIRASVPSHGAAAFRIQKEES